MHLESLRLINFKNYASQSLELDERLNLFVGLNGQGKTNLLDAVHFLCLTKSAASLLDRHLVRHGEPFFRLEGRFRKDGQPCAVAAKFQLGAKKTFERNGSPIARLADHIGQFPVVMSAPDDARLIQDGSEERRRFMDSTLSQSSAESLRALMAYNRLLQQRNALLKRFLDEKRFDQALLEAIDRQMPAPAKLIFEHRQAFATAFEPIFQHRYEAISSGRERVIVRFESDLATEPDLLSHFEKNLEKDRLLSRTTAGPHRDDLAFCFVDGSPIRRFGSQGQLKSFLLALRLAQFEFLKTASGCTPLLMLDDLFDKLDPERIEKLIEIILSDGFGQIFITDAHDERLADLLRAKGVRFRKFTIQNGEAFY